MCYKLLQVDTNKPISFIFQRLSSNFNYECVQLIIQHSHKKKNSLKTCMRLLLRLLQDFFCRCHTPQSAHKKLPNRAPTKGGYWGGYTTPTFLLSKKKIKKMTQLKMKIKGIQVWFLSSSFFFLFPTNHSKNIVVLNCKLSANVFFIHWIRIQLTIEFEFSV